jgi:hypothetical protein
MFARLRRWFRLFWSKSRTINNEPLNKVSLIVLIVIDIIILFNVFTGLDDISRWYISPDQAYPCYADWQAYRSQTTPDKDFDAVRQIVGTDNPQSFQQLYQQGQTDHLGQVNGTCLQYANYQDQTRQAGYQALLKTIEQKQAEIGTLENSNRTIREQYDSTLLEQIAGQPRGQSINQVGAAQARQTLAQNNAKITALKTDITGLKQELITKPESAAFLTFLNEDATFQTVQRGYKRAAFWYPSIQLTFQAFFLVPLLLLSLAIHSFAQQRGYGLMALMSWHLLVIFLIPLLLKIFEFLQVGVLFEFLFDLIKVLFGSLLFLVSYVYILLIPLIGFGLIKLFQTFIFNPKLQAAGRVQKSRCLQCARKLHPQDAYCPHCGYYQYQECPQCHQLTYKHLPHCAQCGAAQE